ncbi:unnamed protein product (macronuclear) [Paramecium tetraurelia]|uniref:Protein kinase domain-containing protein n=1 Tax=Paramecium tetraurelia TaxID=5888 RepID=A0C2Y6_PARTE|nr:uncharacterized protein GSPATT00034631001 [Paramecium tetraurelia]CAK65153.1 unnamed protein product [Paramecium tetraurelia]|eukprot:XP_001432550.1 hypothetical protein (macronuclear) [Paramecium tetraurelia strain d4-2]
MKSSIQSYGFQISIIRFGDEKVYEYKSINNNIAEEFLMCDLFIHSPYLRQHTKMINKEKFIFKFETDKLLSSLQTQDENLLVKIARQLLEAIQILHQHNIPGRTFNINNILWNETQQKITLMEFGLSSPLIIYPPELLNKKYRCYGIEIDQFLIGCVLYQLYFRKPLELQEQLLDMNFRDLNMELSKIRSPLIKELLIGLLQFNLSKRMQFKDLARLLKSNQGIQEFYSQIKTFKPKQNIIDQRIFFRESRQEKSSTYILTDTALQESLIIPLDQSLSSFQSTTQESFKQVKKFSIVENTLMEYQFKLEVSKFQCFDEVISILKDYNQDIVPELCLTILALNFGKVYFHLYLIRELEIENSTCFSKDDLEMKLWKSYKTFNSKTINDEVQKLKTNANMLKVSFDRENEIKCVQLQINKNEVDNLDLLQLQLFNLQYFNNSLSNQEQSNKFLDAYRTQCLIQLQIINENLDFTMNLQTAQKLRQGLILCAFADILFKPQLECHKYILETLNIKEISNYQQFIEYIKLDINSFNEWFQQVVNYLMKHEIGRKYINYLNLIL